MQDHKTNSSSRISTRKPWYQRAIEMATPWKTIGSNNPTSSSFYHHHRVPKPTTIKNPTPINSALWKTTSLTDVIPTMTDNHNNNNKNNSRSSSSTSGRLKKSASLRVAATSFTRVCLCAPITPFNDVFRAEHHHPHQVAPRRSYSYPRSSSTRNSTSSSSSSIQERSPSARLSTEGTRRVVFRGKSLSEDVLMRRFVREEEEAMMQMRRRNEMEVIRKRSLKRRRKLGPSPLSRMVLAEVDEESSSSSYLLPS